MKKIAKFEKISLKQFVLDTEEFKTNIEAAYESIILPKRATLHSAGYDFASPFDFTLNPDESIVIPTGIRAKIDDDYVLCIFPRSSLGFKYQIALCNTVGIIDSDYYEAENEGHIKIKIINNSNKVFSLKSGERFAQGILFNFGITVDDDVVDKRTGGIGSTNWLCAYSLMDKAFDSDSKEWRFDSF